MTTINARPLGKLVTLLLAAGLASCITVNVNFPESAVQKAANDFVADLYKPIKSSAAASSAKDEADSEAAAVRSSVKRTTKKKAKAIAPVPEKQPATETSAPTTFNFSISLMSEAFAQEINTHTPKAQEIKKKMRARIPDIRKWKEKGVICETSDALLVMKHPEKAGRDAGAVLKLVNATNADRDALYAEIADANRITDRKQTRIRKFFAAAFKQHSPAGTCFEP